MSWNSDIWTSTFQLNECAISKMSMSQPILIEIDSGNIVASTFYLLKLMLNFLYNDIEIRLNEDKKRKLQKTRPRKNQCREP